MENEYTGETRYFNFPIPMLADFMEDSEPILSNILVYCCYQKLVKEGMTELEDLAEVEDYYGVELRDKEDAFNRGKRIYEYYECYRGAMVGLNTSIYWDYRNNEKSDFQNATLLAFLAFKSMLQKQPYLKTNNDYLLSRMSGLSKSTNDKTLISKKLKDMFLKGEDYNKYKIKKLKNELCLNWNMSHYAQRTRGFYVSFKLNIDELVYLAEKKKYSNRLKNLNQKEKEARKSALVRLGIDLN